MAGGDGTNAVNQAKTAIISQIWLNEQGEPVKIRTMDNNNIISIITSEGTGNFRKYYEKMPSNSGPLTDADIKLLAHAKDVAQKMISSVWTKVQCKQHENGVECENSDKVALIIEDTDGDGKLDISSRVYSDPELGVTIIQSHNIEGLIHLYDGEKQTPKTEETK